MREVRYGEGRKRQPFRSDEGAVEDVTHFYARKLNALGVRS